MTLKHSDSIALRTKKVCAGSVVVSTLRYHAKGPGFVPRPGRSLLRIIPSQALAAHSAVTSRLGINFVEAEAARERTGHRPHT